MKTNIKKPKIMHNSVNQQKGSHFFTKSTAFEVEYNWRRVVTAYNYNNDKNIVSLSQFNFTR